MVEHGALRKWRCHRRVAPRAAAQFARSRHLRTIRESCIGTVEPGWGQLVPTSHSHRFVGTSCPHPDTDGSWKVSMISESRIGTMNLGSRDSRRSHDQRVWKPALRCCGSRRGRSLFPFSFFLFPSGANSELTGAFSSSLSQNLNDGFTLDPCTAS